jgi:hypothetical protein
VEAEAVAVEAEEEVAEEEVAEGVGDEQTR